ncbi:MAG: response regulator [Acidobacteria bacterium]|nr:response regulator [Acidobacteriota bacterium]
MSVKSILVVDDSPVELQFVTRMLDAKGYAYTTATDGEEAIRKAAEQHPGLVLLDIVLPKKNGYQVCRELKTRPATKDIRVVLVSGKDQDSDRYWGMKQGADDYVVKPVQTEELLNVIAKHMQGFSR